MPSMKSIWSAPDSVLERLSRRGHDREWADFLLCGFYCAVAILFLVVFGFDAVFRGDTAYALILLGFAFAATISYAGIWLSGEYYLARHFAIFILGSLCLYLFYGGGTSNSGPLYLLIVPILAFFLQGVQTGAFSVILLSIIILMMNHGGLFGFDTGRYESFFILRIYACYTIISILAGLFTWFREKAELELLLSQEDLESVTQGDVLTGLANHQFMERLMELEFGRFRRYGTRFSLLAIQIDDLYRIRQKNGTQYSNAILSQLAALLLQKLRSMDIPARWHDDYFLIMLPEATLENAWGTAVRIRGHVSKQTFLSDKITVSIGISEIEDDLEEAIRQAENNMQKAGQGNGDSIVTGRQQKQEQTPDQGSTASNE